MNKSRRQLRIIVMAALATAVFIASLAIVLAPGERSGERAGKPGAALRRGRIPCETREFANTSAHEHSHLALVMNGARRPILPAGVGLDTQRRCTYWLHTHDATGIIHIEPRDRAEGTVFTLQDLFQVMDQPLSERRIGPYAVPAGAPITVWLNKKVYRDGLRGVPLGRHHVIEIQVGKRYPPAPWTTWEQ